MNNFKEIKFRFIPTGVVFTMPEPDVNKFLKTDRGNYEILDKDFELSKQETVLETTTYEQVVEKDPEIEENAVNEREKALGKMKVAELIAFCDEKQIAYDKQDKKADLIAKILEAAV